MPILNLYSWSKISDIFRYYNNWYKNFYISLQEKTTIPEKPTSHGNSIQVDIFTKYGDFIETLNSIKEVKEKVPGAKIYIWSGYTYEQLEHSSHPKAREALRLADFLIDGPFIEEERDVTLEMRGSRNQRIIDLSKKNWYNISIKR